MVTQHKIFAWQISKAMHRKTDLEHVTRAQMTRFLLGNSNQLQQQDRFVGFDPSNNPFAEC